MSVLSKKEIKDRLKRGLDDLDDPSSLVINPLDGDAFDADSIDLRLGTRFLVPEGWKVEAVEFGRARHIAGYQRVVEVAQGGKIVIGAHATILGSVFEFIKLPFDVSAQVLTKSSLARFFITVEGAPWVHPLYRGCLTLEIANSSGTPVKLEPYQPIGQLVFFAVEGARPPRGRDAIDKYAGPIYPELPRPK